MTSASQHPTDTIRAPDSAGPRFAGLAFSVSIMIGAAQAYYGPAMPSMRRQFEVSAATAGTALGAHFLGAVLGAVFWGVLEHRITRRTLLAASTALFAAGCVGVTLASAWVFALPCMLLVGLGSGSLLVGYNTIFATIYGSRGPRMLNLLHACAGIGFILGPAVISVIPGNDFGPAFLITGLLAVVVTPLLLTGPPIAAARVASSLDAPAQVRRTLLAFIMLFVLYVGVETGVSGWAPTHLVVTGMTVTDAARWATAFWAVFTLGRLIAAGISVHVRSDRLVTWALATAVVGLLVATLPGVAPLGYLIAGLALAPVYPTSVAWLTQRLPGVRGGTPLVLGVALLGGVIAPPLVGVIISATDQSLIPLLLAGIAIAAAGVATALLVRPRT